MDIKMRKTCRLATYMTLCFLIICFSNACQFARVVRYNFADINDHKIFPAQVLHPSVQPFYFQQTKPPRYPKVIADDAASDSTVFSTYLKENDTVAFFISYRDTVHFEEYYQGHLREDVVRSFSIAKSVTSILVGIAWDQGLIESVNNSVTQYVPELIDSGFDEITLLHLLQKRVGSTATVHGFRSSFKDWASETTNFPNEVSEMALSHKINSSVEAAYRRGDLLETVS